MSLTNICNFGSCVFLLFFASADSSRNVCEISCLEEFRNKTFGHAWRYGKSTATLSCVPGQDVWELRSRESKDSHLRIVRARVQNASTCVTNWPVHSSTVCFPISAVGVPWCAMCGRWPENSLMGKRRAQRSRR